MIDALTAFAASPAAAFVARLTAVLALGFLAAILLRRQSAAVRHLAWTVTMAGALLVVPASVISPTFEVALPGEFLASILKPASTAAAPSGFVAVDGSHPEFKAVAGAIAAADPAVAANVAPVNSLGGIALAIWLAGAAVFLLWNLLGHAGLARLARRSVAIEEPEWNSLLSEIAGRMHVTRPIRLARSAEVGTPITWGAGHPVILVPDTADEWTADRRRVVLLHEVAHIARLDYATQVLSSLLCALYWPHPLAWIAARRMRAESERAADDRVIVAGTNPTDYATHLLNVARNALALRLTGAVAIGMARKSTLEGRMLALLDNRRDRRATSGPSRALAVVTGLGALIAIAALRPVSASAQDPQQLERQKVELRTAAERELQGRTYSRTIDVNGQTELNIHLRAPASISIIGTDEKRVVVNGKLGPDVQEAALLEERGRIVLRTSGSSRGGDLRSSGFEVRVPRTFNVVIESSGGGLSIEGVNGTFRGNISEGQVTLTRLQGRAELQTGEGDIRVFDSNLEGIVSTSLGNVRLTRLTGNLRGMTSKGEITNGESELRSLTLRGKDGSMYTYTSKEDMRKYELENEKFKEKVGEWDESEKKKFAELFDRLEKSDKEGRKAMELLNEKELKKGDGYFEFMVDTPVKELWVESAKEFAAFSSCDDGSGISAESLSRTARKLYPAEYEIVGRSTKVVGLIFDSNCQLVEHTANERLKGEFTDEQALGQLFPKVGRVKWKVSGFSGVSKDGRGDPMIVWGVKPRE